MHIHTYMYTHIHAQTEINRGIDICELTPIHTMCQCMKEEYNAIQKKICPLHTHTMYEEENTV